MIPTTRASPSHDRFRQLFGSHYRSVLAYALRRCATVQDAEEVAAETFAVAWRRIGDLRHDDEALPWLYAIATRVLANQRRAGRRLEAVRARLWRQPRGVDEPSSDEWRGVVGALRRLPAADQEVLRLSAWEGLTHRDIALVLGCSENAVAVRLHRARRRLATETGKTMAQAPEEGR